MLGLKMAEPIWFLGGVGGGGGYCLVCLFSFVGQLSSYGLWSILSLINFLCCFSKMAELVLGAGQR
jgi:hypothetical protein